MRRIALHTIAAAVAVALAGTTAASAAPAPDSIYGSVDCAQAPSAACDIAAGTRPPQPNVNDQHLTDTHGQSSTADSEFGCRYVPVEHHPPGGQPQEPGGWYMVLCSPDGKDPDSRGPVWIPAGQTTPPALTPQQVAQIARGRLRLPAPTITASPAGTQLVHLPTWLWLSGGWTPSSATASVPGVSVTAVATPMTLTWSMGDGGTVTCTGPGTPFSTDVDPKSASPDCGHVYRRSSVHEPGQTFRVSATVHWTVTWSGAGQSGTFPDLTTTNSAALRVAESQALNNGRR